MRRRLSGLCSRTESAGDDQPSAVPCARSVRRWRTERTRSPCWISDLGRYLICAPLHTSHRRDREVLEGLAVHAFGLSFAFLFRPPPKGPLFYRPGFVELLDECDLSRRPHSTWSCQCPRPGILLDIAPPRNLERIVRRPSQASPSHTGRHYASFSQPSPPCSAYTCQSTGGLRRCSRATKFTTLR